MFGAALEQNLLAAENKVCLHNAKYAFPLPPIADYFEVKMGRWRLLEYSASLICLLPPPVLCDVLLEVENDNDYGEER